MKTLNHCDFKEMSWKNGGGVTSELFSIRDNEGTLLFRLSSAVVSQNGSFSIFPEIDRIIALISGKGFVLKSKLFEKTIDQSSQPWKFSGEEEIYCTLLDGECLDFNVMTKRSYGSSSLEIDFIHKNGQLVANEDLLLVYLPQDKILHILDHGEIFTNTREESLRAYQVRLSLIK